MTKRLDLHRIEPDTRLKPVLVMRRCEMGAFE